MPVNPFKRRRILRQIYQEERSMLEQEQSLLSSGRLRAEEQEEIGERLTKLERLLAQVAPREPLDWPSLLFRFGAATLVFYVITAVPYQFVRSQYLHPQLVNVSQGVGQAQVSQFIPVTKIDATDWPLVKPTAVFGPRQIDSRPDLKGMTAGLVPSGRDGLALLWTAEKDGKRVLWRQELDSVARPVHASTTLWDDVDLENASAIGNAAGVTAVVGTTIERGQRKLLLQAFDPKWQPITAQVVLPIQRPDESLEGAQIFPWNSGWVVLSEIIPASGGSAQNRRETLMRILDKDFRMLWERTLTVDSLHTDRFSSFAPDTENQGGFYVFTNGRPSIVTTLQERGDEVYALRFNRFGELIAIFQLTNNGRPHDFWPSGYAFDQGLHYVSFSQVRATGFTNAQEPAGYPVNTGKLFVFVYGNKFKNAGSLFVFEGPPAQPGEAKVGATHARLSKVGHRLFVAYDVLKTDDPERDVPTRTVEVQAIDVNQ